VNRRCWWGVGAAAVLWALSCAPAAGGPPRGFGPDGGGGGRRYINPGTLAALEGFTHAVKVGSTVYVSGEVALDSLGRLVGAGDLKAQAAQAFANLTQVLRIAGAMPGDVTKLTVYVVNYKPDDFAAIRAAGAAFFPARNPPAGTVIGIQTLPRDGLLIAVDAIAYAPGDFLPRRGLER
jgi:enamine deaminase RidA (YjgF/YER057c/UK114 family)